MLRQAEYSRRYRRRHPTEQREFQRRSDAARQRERRRYTDEYKLSRGCADCGYKDHPAALDFDHRPGVTKTFGVARGLASRSWNAVLEEIAKCDVVCANCHRIRTVERLHAASAS